MVRSGEMAGAVDAQLSLPNPFSSTAAPRRPTTTAAPGYPPAEMPRSTTWSTFSSRAADMPTSVGGLLGKPSPPAVASTTPVKKGTKRNRGLRDAGRPPRGQAGGTRQREGTAERDCGPGRSTQAATSAYLSGRPDVPG